MTIMKCIQTGLGILMALLITGTATAQDLMCGDYLVKKSLEEKYPGYIEAFNTTFEEAKQRGKNSDQDRSFDIYTIDVVVHVVYQDEEQNLHDSIIFSQIATLNEDFNRLNVDAANTRPVFLDRVGSAGIHFRLTDIIRVQTTSKFTPDLFGGLPDNVKVTSEGGSNAVDPAAHLNLWVCKLEPITIFNIPIGQVLGYAYPPAGLSHWPEGVSAPSPGLDGVVIDYRIFGRNNTLTIDPGTGQAISGYGRTTVHEIGHYLGLRHIWGDPDIFGGGDGCLVDDGVEDTPNQQRSSEWTCNHDQNTCPGEGLPDMIENYMDYSEETCMNSFTLGQIEVMRGVLEGPRSGLIENSVSSRRKESDLHIHLYPNPVTGSSLHIEIASPVKQGLWVEFFNSVGQKVLRPEHVVDGAAVSIEGLQPGLYYIRFFEKDQPDTWTIKKIIKH